MNPETVLIRTRVLLNWINRDAVTVTVARVTPTRNNSGGSTPGTPATVPGIRGRLTRSPLPRHQPGDPETTIGMTERDYDRFVCVPNTDLTKVLMTGDTFTAGGIKYECTRVLIYPWKRNAVIEKR